MLRKALIGVIAAGTVALGVTATTTTAEARHRHGHFGIYIGVPLVVHGSLHKHGHCHWVKWKKKNGVWKYKKKCHSYGHRHGHH
ncbi:MAG: hypothetical protein GYA66_07290 [Phyllobacteriaceae bacterium]|nr:hypothetical protein [Phyllobacteriaceae bacterium]